MMTMNKQVAVSPFPTKSIKPVVMKGGLVGVAQKVELTSLDVILPSEDGRFKPGMKVYVRGDIAVQDYTNNIQNIGGCTFFLLPDSAVMLVEGE